MVELNKTPSVYDRNWRVGENENWDILTQIFKDGIDKVMSMEAVEKAISEWLANNDFKPKEAVDTFSDLPADAELKELRGVIDENSIYVFDGTQWVKQSNINFDGLTDVKNSVNAIDAEVSNVKGEVDTVKTEFSDITLNVRSFGVSPNSTTDQSVLIQEAINATPEGGTLTFPKGTYVGTFNLPKSIKLNMKDSTIIPPDGTTKIITATGQRDIEDYKLSSTLKRGDKTITLTVAPTTISAGDMIVVKDDSVRASDSAKNVNMEVHEVLSVSSNKITIKDFIRLPKSISSTSNVYKFTPIKNIEIYDLIQKPVDGATNNHGIYLEYCRDIYLNNIKMTNGVAPAVIFKSCYNYHINKFDIRQPQLTGGGQGYGVQSIGGTLYGTITNGYADGLRHTTDCGNAFDIHVSNVVSLNSKSSHFVLSHNGWDSDNSVSNCHGSNPNDDNAVYAVNSSSIGTGETYDLINYNFRVEDNTFMLPDNNSKGVVFPKVVKDSYIKNNNIIFGNGEIPTSKDNVGISTTPVDNTLIIEGNTIKGANDALRHYEAVSKYQTNNSDVIKVLNNTIKNCKVAHYYQFAKAIKIIGNDYDTITDKIFRLIQASSGEKIQYLTIKDVNVSNFKEGTLIEHNSLYRFSGGVVGEVKNINVDGLGSNNISITPDYLITLEDILIRNELVRTTPSTTEVTLHPKAFHKGLVEGQRMRILKPGRTLKIPHNPDYVLNSSGATLTVDRTVEYVFSGDRWWEV